MSPDNSFRATGGHIVSVKFNWQRISALCRFTREASMIGALWVVYGLGYLSLGWGWDDRFPLRPWPVPWSAPPAQDGRIYRSLTWCGFWIGVAL